jgi:hypothetical protein
MLRPFAACALMLLTCAAIAGCNGAARIDRGPAPDFEQAVADHNKSIGSIDRLWARATVQIRYTDDQGKRRFEQGEGHLRMEPPGLVALSAGKVGETLFWLGGDDHRYWWFDLTGRERLAYVGRYGGPGQGKGGLAASVQPRDLAHLMGLLPLYPPGEADWSNDQSLLGLVALLPDDRYERRWIDPDTHEVVQIELFDAQQKPLLTAELGEYRHMTITGQGAPGPRVPTQIFIGDVASGTEVRLYLTDVGDGAGRWEPAAFDFERLIGALRAQKVFDLDGRLDRPNWGGFE